MPKIEKMKTIKSERQSLNSLGTQSIMSTSINTNNPVLKQLKDIQEIMEEDD